MTHRNGYRLREWQMRAGTVELQILKLRRGSYFPSFLEPRRRSEQALFGGDPEAYVCGVSTRRVDQPVESLGLRASKSEVSRIYRVRHTCRTTCGQAAPAPPSCLRAAAAATMFPFWS